LKHGGRFFCLEFSTSEWPGFADVYDLWADKMIPRIGKAVARDEASYRYLVESIRRFPKPEQFRQMIADAGFAQTKAEPILGGLVCIHSGWRI
jgi:demethylmenaquinone methyltransferase/2-methoxy-6-polyprenyl-1,4-benzoquinol methylase